MQSSYFKQKIYLFTTMSFVSHKRVCLNKLRNCLSLSNANNNVVRYASFYCFISIKLRVSPNKTKNIIKQKCLI